MGAFMKNELKLFDVHCHIMNAYSLYTGGAHYKEPSLGNTRQLVKYMDECGLEKLAIPAITLYDSPDLSCNPLALYAKTLAPGRIFALAGLRRSLKREGNTGMAEQARRLLSAGFDGIKMICKPNVRRVFHFPINDPMFDEFYGVSEKEGWPILFHVADPLYCWNDPPENFVKLGWYYGKDTHVPSYEILYEETFDVLKRHPALRITFAHFFFMGDRLDEVPPLLEAYPNICFDVTPGGEMYVSFSRQREEARRIFTRYADRFVFGTDFSAGPNENDDTVMRNALNHINNMRRFFETDDSFDSFGKTVRGLGLDSKVLAKLYHENFSRMLGKKPKPVDTALAASLCGEYLGLVKSDDPHGPNTIGILETLEGLFKAGAG
jgi:predicted TIM-barrel fold metal-dependent hydrolase